jgi:hypothetical protein
MERCRAPARQLALPPRPRLRLFLRPASPSWGPVRGRVVAARGTLAHRCSQCTGWPTQSPRVHPARQRLCPCPLTPLAPPPPPPPPMGRHQPGCAVGVRAADPLRAVGHPRAQEELCVHGWVARLHDDRNRLLAARSVAGTCVSLSWRSATSWQPPAAVSVCSAACRRHHCAPGPSRRLLHHHEPRLRRPPGAAREPEGTQAAFLSYTT